MIPKFRVWNKEEKKIKTISRIHFDNGEVVSIGIVPEGQYAIREYSIDDYELMQSTGMKDKNGIEIYEGDVVKINKWISNKRMIGIVEYYGAAFRVRGVKQYLGSEDKLNSLYVVIGNKFEQPYLLEEDNHASD